MPSRDGLLFPVARGGFGNGVPPSPRCQFRAGLVSRLGGPWRREAAKCTRRGSGANACSRKCPRIFDSREGCFQRCLPRVAPRLSMTIAFLQDCSCLDWLHNSAAGFEQLQSEPILHRGGTIHCAFGWLKLEWCERKILLGWLELELVAGVV